MADPVRQSLIIVVVAFALLVPQGFAGLEAAGQEANPQATRPRRVLGGGPATPVTPAADQTSAVGTSRLNAEPLIRIGLTTGAHSVVISTSGHLLSTDSDLAAPSPVAAARVRIEAHALSPASLASARAPADNFAVKVACGSTREEAEQCAAEVKALTGQASMAAFDLGTSLWQLRVGSRLSAEEAGALRIRLEESGYAPASIVNERAADATTRPPAQYGGPGAPTSSVPLPIQSGVRLTGRPGAPSREMVCFAASSVLFHSRSPLSFASDDESRAPVRFNDKPYRGRIEVFPNEAGSLTVVNVLPLEDYVRGVVPNELSPGSYPAIEALKAQAVAARTYAVKHRSQFAAEGFDLLPTTRSQVYGGVSTEQPLSTRAVEETRGIIATYRGEPIDALYTSTCGGRTENVENIFSGEAVPYLRSRECGGEGPAPLAPFVIRTSREPVEARAESDVAAARDVAVLAVHGFHFTQSHLTGGWLEAPVTAAELRDWLSTVSSLSHPPSAALLTDEATRPAGFSTALLTAMFGENRAGTLLANADVEYLLAFRDAGEIPAANRADVALLLRDGYLSLLPDATLRPREVISRARALHAIARLLEGRGSLHLQSATARPSGGEVLILRSARGHDQPLEIESQAYLFRAFGENVYGMRSLTIVGGEPVIFHLDARGKIDYLEAKPAPNGATAERFSPFTNWTTVLRPLEVQARLAHFAGRTGSLVDLRVTERGASRRVIDLEIIGTTGTAHIRGGRIRSALGLREQLFVIDRQYDEAGRISEFVFHGRGWGHGVGMCQVGAYGLARSGYTYDRILKAYYTGIDLTRLY